jgi:hypothetical protein
LLHIEAASTETTKEEHNKTEAAIVRRSNLLRNSVSRHTLSERLGKNLAVNPHAST